MPELEDEDQIYFKKLFDYGLYRGGAYNLTLYQWMNTDYNGRV